MAHEEGCVTNIAHRMSEEVDERLAGRDTDVVVVGSCMIDHTCYAPELPHAGATVHGTRYTTSFGGKGANQCVMCAQLGLETTLIAKLGSDAVADSYLQHLRDTGVQCSHVTKAADVTCGVAQICVDQSGRNSIVVVAGANELLSVDDVSEAECVIATASVLLCQLEVPIATVKRALELGKLHKLVTILNAAPAVDIDDAELFKLVDVLCVNESEAQTLSGVCSRDIGCMKVIARSLLGRLSTSGHTTAAIVTLGERGAVVASRNHSGAISTAHVALETRVPVVDTTGAGDAFMGMLAYYMARTRHRVPLIEAVRRACHVASLTVSRPGTQASYPRRSQLPDQLFN